MKVGTELLEQLKNFYESQSQHQQWSPWSKSSSIAKWWHCVVNKEHQDPDDPIAFNDQLTVKLPA